nr:hypothetical protein [uncultured Mitsuokella sp.]
MEEFASIRRIPIIRANERDVFCRLIREANAHRILEVGTAIGYSTLLLAKESPKDVHITTVEKNKKRAGQARFFFGNLLMTVKFGYALAMRVPF